MPWRDWQFWLVTLAAAWGLWALVRQLLPTQGHDQPPCSSCDLGAEANGARGERKALESGDPRAPN